MMQGMSQICHGAQTGSKCNQWDRKLHYLQPNRLNERIKGKCLLIYESLSTAVHDDPHDHE